jgi:spore maturation protein SpmB
MVTASLRTHLTESAEQSVRTVWWLVRIMVPASFLVFVLQQTGLLSLIARIVEPVMSLLGLPGAAAMAVISSVLVNLFAVIAMVPALGLTQRQLVILALLCLVAHSFLVELLITRKTGTPVLRMLAVRTFGGLILAYWASVALPTTGAWSELIRTGDANLSTAATVAFLPALGNWAVVTAQLVGRVALIVTVLVVAMRWLHYVGVMDYLAAVLRPVTFLFALPRAAGLPWIVANTLGLTYGSAALAEAAASGQLSMEDGDLLNHHLGVSHSLIEDTFLFAALGAPILWIMIPRLVLALIAVLERRAERVVFGRHRSQTA